MIRSHRLALVASAAILGLTTAACGDPSSQTASTATVASSLPVIHLRAGSGSGGATPAAAESDRMMMPYGTFVFVVDGTLPALDGTAPAWRFPAGADLDEARVAAIAAALGVEGEVRTLGADMGGGWMVGPEDYSAATLTVSADGMLNWWFSPAPQEMRGVECGQVVGPIDAIEPDAPATDETTPAADDVPVDTVEPGMPCEEPLPPTGVPDAATAEQSAKDLFASLGYDPAAYEYETYADEWGASVTAWLMLDGVRAPITLSVGFGAEGAVTWASGSLASPEPVGEYPLVGTTAGIDRLNDQSGQWMWFGYGGPAVMARDTGVAVETADAPTGADGSTGAAPATEPAAMPIAPPDETAPSCDPAADCVVDEMPPPEEITVTITGATMGLTQIWDADGTVWLLPMYVFTTADGGEWSVIAVDDSFIELPAVELPVPEPMPVDTAVSGGTGDGAGDGVGTVAPLPAEVDPAAAEVLVGLEEDEAAKVAEGNGWGFRVVRADGVDFAVTADYSPTRVNVELTQGVVTAIVSIG